MDDAEMVREVLAQMLESLGYEVECVKTGEEAIEAYRQSIHDERPFSACIMDLTIPGGMGGDEALETLRELDPDIKAIVTSGYSNDPIMAQAAEYGFRGVLPKPFGYDEVARVLHTVINGK
jgi:CheY-like chemotaxis protein